MTQRSALPIALCAAALLAPAHAAVNDYPAKTVRIVVPSRPAGTADAVAQMLSEQLRNVWKTQVVIDHRPGPGGKIGAEVVAKAQPDGYTVLLASTSLATAPALYRNVRYDAGRDLAPAAGVGISPFVILVQPSAPVRSVSELVSFAKKAPERLAHGVSGPGSVEHLCGEMLGQMAGVRLMTAPFDSRGAALDALAAGKVPFVFADLPHALPRLKSGKLRAIGITSAMRSSALPEVPAVAESLPGFQCASWLAVFVPANTPLAVREALRAAVARAIHTRDADERLRAEGLYPYPNSAEEFARFYRAELPKWAKVARTSGIQLE